MWWSSGVLNLPYIFRTLKRVYKVGISTKLLKMSSFCRNMACGYRERESGVDLSDIYVWRMDLMATSTKHSPDAVLMLSHRLRRWPNIKPALVNIFTVTTPLISPNNTLFPQGNIRERKHRHTWRGE